MPAFLVTVRRSGPNWDPSLPLEQQSGWTAHPAFMDGLVEDGFIVLGGPLADEYRVVHAVEAESEDAVSATFARDPWARRTSTSTRSSRGRSGSMVDPNDEESGIDRTRRTRRAAGLVSRPTCDRGSSRR